MKLTLSHPSPIFVAIAQKTVEHFGCSVGESPGKMYLGAPHPVYNCEKNRSIGEIMGSSKLAAWRFVIVAGDIIKGIVDVPLGSSEHPFGHSSAIGHISAGDYGPRFNQALGLLDSIPLNETFSLKCIEF